MTAAPSNMRPASRLVPVTDDARAELVGSAQRHERRNRPKILIVLSLLVAAIAVVYLIFAASELRGVHDELTIEQSQTAEIRTLGDKLLAMQADLDGEEMRQRLDPSLAVFADLERLSREAGLIQGNNLRLEDRGQQDTIKDTELVRKKWHANLTAQPAEAIFKWLTEASKINGLEVSFINEFKPGAGTPEGEPRWDCQVIFVRIQKKPGAK